MTGRSMGGYVIASRPSTLARIQAESVRRMLEARGHRVGELQVIRTTGDRVLDRPLPEIGGKGLFTAELEEALRQGEIDLAVHSLKDLPLESPPGIRVAAIPAREDPRDALVSARYSSMADLPPGAVVGSSSLRRQAQLLAVRPDLTIEPLRGNVETRLRKVAQGEFAAAVLAAAGLIRLGLTESIAERLSFDRMLPAPGQGALAVQCRDDDEATLAALADIDEPEIRRTVEAERAFLEGLGGGCSAPVGAYAQVEDGRLQLAGLIASVDGKRIVRVRGEGNSPRELGSRLAEEALRQGAEALLAHA
ncbi:MAG TPA: hydroxymethylbilane synthase [Anaerolineales bacterium]|nr:hydroxymethylbilane synthase [Anaerolineales bacterium]